MIKRVTFLMILACLAVSGFSCKKEETTLEKIQRKTKEAAEKTSEAVEEAVED